MKKVITFFIVLFVGVLSVQAENTLTLCEYSDEYKAWLKLSDEEKKETVVPPFCKSRKLDMDLLGNNSYAMDYFNLADSGKVTGVRDQKESGACWAFASLASIESNLLMNNIDISFLSPAHLELMTQNSLYTPSFMTFNRDFNVGGNMYLAAAYFLNNWGPIKESDMPFQTIIDLLNVTRTITEEDVTSKEPVASVDNILYLTNDQGICSNNSIDSIKQYIVNYGAIAAGVYFDSNYLDYVKVNDIESGDIEMGPYYYYNGSTLPNHAVAIVGWDDTIDASHFKNKPSRDGAWIVKNSYGSNKVGNEGYFYISYDDTNICTNTVGFYNTSLDINDEAYYYDDLGANTYVEVNNDVSYLANYFVKNSQEIEKLDKVTFASGISGLNYTVYYAKNIEGRLEDWQEIGSGVTTHDGYISVYPDKDIYVDNSYGIIVKFEPSDSVDHVILTAVESTDDDYYANYQITDNASRISFDGNVWQKIVLEIEENEKVDVQLAIRAYTDYYEEDSDEEIIPPQEENPNDEEINSNPEVPNIDDDGTIEVENPNGSLSDIVGDIVPSDTPTEIIENPQTGVISGISIIIVLTIIGVVIYYKKKNKIFKI